jgi:predicted amino acid-binding ACT domain protein
MIIITKIWVYLIYLSTSILGVLLECHLNIFSSDQTMKQSILTFVLITSIYIE